MYLSGNSIDMKHFKTTDYLRFMQEEIDRLRRDGRFSTADNYCKALAGFRRWIGADAFELSRLTPSVMESYGSYLSSKGLLRNSVSFHMRILRAVYNKARNGIPAAQNPFANVYTGVDWTRKRAVSYEFIRKLHRLNICSDALTLSRDLFVFSFCARGMSFVDIAYLNRSCVKDGAIRYWRHKTGQQMFIKIEPCMVDIMSRYADIDSPYVFPVLTSTDREEAYVQYKRALTKHNRNLKVLSAMVDSSVALSTYSARHSWATSARDRNIPVSVISAGLGHTSERTTRIYISTLDNSVVDRANELIISGIL